MTGNTPTLVIPFVLLLFLTPWFKGRVSVRLVALRLKNKLPGTAYDACGSKRASVFYGTSIANCRRPDMFVRKAGFIQILSSANSGKPPCKSGQLEKDLGLDASSLRHAAWAIIFEIMISFSLVQAAGG